MHIKDLKLSDSAEDWVIAAFNKHTRVEGGAFAVVIFPEDERYVVKLTTSKTDYDALIHFSGSSPHFPKVYKYGEFQGLIENQACHALLVERVTVSPIDVSVLSDHIHGQESGKSRPFGLLKTAQDIKLGAFNTQYPISLAEALEKLGIYAFQKMLYVDLDKQLNWGQRDDGTLVAIDLVHSSSELNG